MIKAEVRKKGFYVQGFDCFEIDSVLLTIYFMKEGKELKVVQADGSIAVMKVVSCIKIDEDSPFKDVLEDEEDGWVN